MSFWGSGDLALSAGSGRCQREGTLHSTPGGAAASVLSWTPLSLAQEKEMTILVGR